jgi:lipopolysaccharide export system permease protein
VILFRYIVREILTTLLAVTFTLVVIVVSGRLVKYLASAAAGDLAPDILFAVILYRLPGFLELIVPLAFFISVLLALGRLYVDSEMTVMSACGLSRRRLVLIVLAPALLVAALVATLSLAVSPYGIAKVQDIFSEAESRTGLELLVAGRFRVLDERRGRVTYVEDFEAESGHMMDVFAAERITSADGDPLQVVLMAESGRTEIDPETGERYLVLERGSRFVGQPGRLDFQRMDFAEMRQWLEQRHAEPMLRKRDGMTTGELWEADALPLVATLQWRISLALLVVISTLIAVSMARTDHRRGRYGKLFPAFSLFMVYLLLLNAAREAVSKGQLPPQLGLWFVHAIFLVIGLALVFGGDRWRGWRIRRRNAALAEAA